MQPIKTSHLADSNGVTTPLAGFMRAVTGQLESHGHIGTARNYNATLSSITSFTGQHDIGVSDITTQFISDYYAPNATPR